MMRIALATVAAMLAFAILASSPMASAAPVGSPSYANRMLSGFSTPTVSPGHTVDFAFSITNPYDPARIMTGILVTVSIYKYATQEGTKDVNDSFANPPLMEGGSTAASVSIQNLYFNTTQRIELPIETTGKTPHGSIFSQATYFVRIRVSFNFNGNATQCVFMSRGWFTDQEWNSIVSFAAGESIVNTTRLKELGADGLIPDSSFGIKEPIPVWPLGVVIAACAGTAFMAFFYFVLDNPGKYPKLEKRFYYLRGKVSQLGGKFKNGR